MLRYSANENAIRNALSQSLSFPVPLDKGNAGSGNEIGENLIKSHACAFDQNVVTGSFNGNGLFSKEPLVRIS